MNLIGIQQNIWSIKIGIFLSYTLWLKIVSGTSTHGNYDCPKLFFFSPHLYHIYFKFFLPKISDVTAQLSCAMDFVEAATGWKHVIVRDVQSWFAHKTFCCQLIEIIITLHISQISQLSSSPSSGCTSSAALRAPWMSFFAHSLVSSSHTLTAS